MSDEIKTNIMADLLAEGGVDAVAPDQEAPETDAVRNGEDRPGYGRPTGFLVNFNDFKHLVPPGISEKQFARLSDSGNAPPYMRISPQGRAFYNGKQVKQFFEEKYQAIGGIADIVPMRDPKKIEAYLDGEPPYVNQWHYSDEDRED
jgi:hypothetical protein